MAYVPIFFPSVIYGPDGHWVTVESPQRAAMFDITYGAAVIAPPPSVAVVPTVVGELTTLQKLLMKPRRRVGRGFLGD